MSILKIITPTNLQSEREKFFNSSHYHPQFSYDWENVKVGDSPLINAIIHQDTWQITNLAEQHFGSIWSNKVLEKSKKIVSASPLKLPPVPTLSELVKSQEIAFKQLGIDYQVVVTDKTGFVARPEHKNKRLLVSSDVNYHYFSKASSIRHDIVHIIRYLNGQYNQIERSPDYLPTEEGLASYIQDYGGHELNASLFQHAAEYAVTDICRKGSLRDGVEYLISLGFPSKLAWQRASRHKFGFRDTAKPGDIMKPAMYFFYEQTIKQIPQTDVIKLFIGKISLAKLPEHQQYIGRWAQTQLLDFFFS